MRAAFPAVDEANIAAHVEASPGIEVLRSLGGTFGNAQPETVAAIVSEASRFAMGHLAELNETIDGRPLVLEDGRVKLAPEHKVAWKAFVDGGWTTMDSGEEWGGQGLPRILSAVAQQIFDRSSMTFVALAVPQRSASRLIGQFGSDELKNEWLPKLVSGEWAATICISEPDAGSDVFRLRTEARPADDGTWRVTGQKCWISYGDHDLTDRIGHLLLARTAGAKGLSLFLVPDTVADADGAFSRNGIEIRRVEKKLGLHGSPTCLMGFDDAKAWLIGEEGAGLNQMFVMITNMRLSVGATGASLASGCLDTARQYAEDRIQGNIDKMPVPIAEHADVQRQILLMAGRTETLQGLVMALANFADLAAHHPDKDYRAKAQETVEWLLPIVKTIGGETAFEVANQALQVLGAAGYMGEWPIEQALRDSRALTIFEGTSGIQAHDLMNRRLIRGDGGGLTNMLTLGREALAAYEGPHRASAEQCLDMMEAAGQWLRSPERSPRERDAASTPFLQIAGAGAMCWIALRLAKLKTGVSETERRIGSSADYYLHDLGARAACLHAQILSAGSSLDEFPKIRAL